MDHLPQFTSDICHIDGPRTEVDGAFLRPSIAHLQLFPGIHLVEMDAEQCRLGSSCDEKRFQTPTAGPATEYWKRCHHLWSPPLPTVICAAIPPPQNLLPAQHFPPCDSSYRQAGLQPFRLT
ncbi:hypothetical protein SprV_0702324100 [Sparganum proliferum]